MRISLLALLFLLLLSCSKQPDSLRAVDGYIDLRTYDFSSSNPINLNGTWEYVWDKVLSPQQWKQTPADSIKPYHFPQSWMLIGKPAEGHATFHLRVLVDSKKNHVISFLCKEQSTAYKLYANGIPVLSNGTVGTSRSSEIPQAVLATGTIPVTSDTVDLILQLSNYHIDFGGPVYPIKIGTSDRLLRWIAVPFTAQILCLGFMIVFFFQYGLVWFGTRNEKSYLYFGIVCILWFIITIMDTSEFRLITILFPNFPFEWLNKLYYPLIIVCMPLLRFFFVSIIPSRVNHIIAYLLSAVALWYLGLALFTDSSVYVPLFPVVISNTRIFLLFLFGSLIINVFKRVQGAAILLCGVIGYYASTINDTRYYMGEIDSFLMMTYGATTLIIAEALLLVNRMNRTYKANANLLVELTESHKELTRISVMKDDFLANTSHELRTPLHGIQGITESLFTDPAVKDSPFLQQNLQLVTQSARRLNLLVNDILDFAKIRHQELHLTRRSVSLAETVALVLPHFQQTLEKNGTMIQNNIDSSLPLIYADQDRLIQMLFNLIGNAVKFTDHGTITLSAIADTATVQIGIKDTGIGIHPEALGHIFKPFEQAMEHRTEYRGGTGLGLSITQKLAELHEGTITVESKVGEGSLFTLTIPCAKDQTESYSAHHFPEPIIQKMTGESTGYHGELSSDSIIVVIDDEPVNLQIIQNHLAQAGITAITHENPETALALIDKTTPDLILLDIMMPKKNGYDLCREIRQKYSASELPVIFLSAKNRLEDLVFGFEVGGNDYLLKPFLRDELLARISTHIQLRKAWNSVVENQKLKESIAQYVQEKEYQWIIRTHIASRFSASSEAIIAINENDQICFATDRAFELLGTSFQNSSTTHYFSSLFSNTPESFSDQFSGELKLADTGKCFQGTVRKLSIEDMEFWIVLLSENDADEAILSLLENSEESTQKLSKNLVELGVSTMSRVVQIWETITEKTRAEFARESGCWRVQIDRNGWERTQTLDKYLSYSKFPALPRWKFVLQSIYFLIALTESNQSHADYREELQHFLIRLEQMGIR